MKTDKELLADAIYIINQLDMAFKESEQLLLMSFKRLSPNKRDEMVRLFLPEYLRADSEEFIKNVSRAKPTLGDVKCTKR